MSTRRMRRAGGCLNRSPLVRFLGLRSGPEGEPPEVSVSVGEELKLFGSVRDEGLPRDGRLTSAWRMLAGSGQVTFSTPDEPRTLARFDTPGAYELELQGERLGAGDRPAAHRPRGGPGRGVASPRARAGDEPAGSVRAPPLLRPRRQRPMSKTSPRFLALLRGLNVGGQNVIAKDDLIRCFEDLGFESGTTYIQSGNVLFRASETRVAALTRAIEAQLSERLSNRVQAVVFTRARYRARARGGPRRPWGRDDDRKHNALFPLRGVTPQRIVEQLPVPKPDIETLATGRGVIFWSISKQNQNRTTWMKLAAAPVYQQVTVRNHRTVFRLRELLDEL